MQELIARLERATGPDPEIDAEIWMTLHPAWRTYPRTKAGGWLTPDGVTRPAEPYTGSFDAAMTLVPDDWHIKLTTRRPSKLAGSAATAGCYTGQTPTIWADASTPAIATCITALKARAAQQAVSPDPDATAMRAEAK